MQVLVRRRGYTLIEFLVVLAIVLILAAILYPVTRGDHENAPRASCQSQLKQIGLAFLQYTQDYDEKMAPVAAFAVNRSFGQPYGWADAIQPYCKSTQLLQCPSEATAGQGTDATQRGFTDYWMNANLSRVLMTRFYSHAQTILCGDGNDGSDTTNARYSLRALPRAWMDDEHSPARRHLDTSNFLFADGHVKALKANRIVSGTPPEGAATFALKWRQ